jgi:hypothetical protein
MNNNTLKLIKKSKNKRKKRLNNLKRKEVKTVKDIGKLPTSEIQVIEKKTIEEESGEEESGEEESGEEDSGEEESGEEESGEEDSGEEESGDNGKGTGLGVSSNKKRVARLKKLKKEELDEESLEKDAKDDTEDIVEKDASDSGDDTPDDTPDDSGEEASDSGDDTSDSGDDTSDSGDDTSDSGDDSVKKKEKGVNKVTNKDSSSSNDETNSDETNSNDESLFYNSNDMIDVDVIKNVQDKEDELFELELENALLKQLPFSKQNNIYYQTVVNEKVKLFYSLYKLSLIKTEFKLEPIKKDIYNYKFNKLVVPITEHKKRIYVDDEYDFNKSDYFYYVNEENEMKKFNRIIDDFKMGNIYFNEYNIELSKFISDANININKRGLIMCPVESFDSLNYNNIDNIDWSMKRNVSKYCLDIKSGPDIDKQCLIYGDDTNIIGFVVLKDIKDNIFNKLENKTIYDNSKYGKISNITHISNNKNAILTCPNHNLRNDNYVIIRNSSLAINGIYNNRDLHIIDDNKFTLNLNTTSFKIKGDLGEIYGKLKLSIANTVIHKKKITKDDFYKFIEKNIPNIKDILIDKLKEVTDLKEVRDFVNLMINNSFDYLDYNQMLIINNLLNDKINDILQRKNVFTNSSNNKTEDLLNNLISDEILNQKEIIDVYGKCIHTKPLQRLNWLLNQKDSGEFYYAFILYKSKDEQRSTKKQDLINIYKKKKKELEIKLDSNKECFKFKYELEREDELKNLKDIKNGDYAFIKDKYHIYVYDGNNWKNIKNVNDIKSLKELCIFKNTNLSKIKLNDLTCIYKNNECNIRSHNHYLKLYENYTTLLHSLELPITVESDYEKVLRKITLINYRKGKKHVKGVDGEDGEGEDGEGEDGDGEKGDDRDRHSNVELYNSIFKLTDKTEMRYLLYEAFKIDCIMIGNSIYSKKYKQRVICGHWYYIIQYEQLSPLNRINILKQLMNNYGKETDGVISCKHCGSVLDLVDYDDVSFTKDGKLRISRAVIKDETVTHVDKRKDIISFENINCNDSVFSNYLIGKGIVGKNLEISIDICNTLKSITSKIGMILKTDDLINIILTALEKIRNLYNLRTFTSIKKKVLIKQGKEKLIDKLEENDYFVNKHYEYYNMNKYGLICCILLIYIQTSIPKYLLKNPKTSCTLHSIEDKKGVEYFACIVKELNLLNYEFIVKKTKKTKTIDYNDILESFEEIYYNLLKDKPINELFKLRGEYDSLLKKKVEKKNVKTFISLLRGNKIPIELPSNYSDYLLGKKGKTDIENDTIRHYKRNKYVNMEIMNIIEYVISLYDLDNTLTIVNYCCPNRLENKENYMKYVSDKKKEIVPLINEAVKNNIYNELIVKRGSLSIMFPKYKGFNTLTILDNIDYEDIYYQTNQYYNIKAIKLNDNEKVNENLNDKKIGEKRIYIGTDKYDVVSGEYKKDIIKTVIDAKEYTMFLDKRKKKNMYKNTIKEITKKDYDDLKSQDYVNRIDGFVDKLSHYSNKSLKSLKTKLVNLGLITGEQHDVDRLQFKDDMNINSIRISNIKSYINDYFRKYINIIKNKHQIKFIPDLDMEKEEKEEFRNDLISEYNYFKEFFEYDFIFQQIGEFEYNFEEIDNFNGEKSVYSSTWNKKLKSAKYDYKLVGDILMYILLTQLDLILYDKKTIEHNNRSVSAETINILLVKFILKVFDKIEYDFLKTNVDENEYRKYRQGLHFQNNKRNNRIVSDTQKDFLSKIYGEEDKTALIEKIKEHKETMYEKYKDKVEHVEESHTDTSSQLFDDKVDESIYEDQIDEDIRDEYDISRPGEIDEVLDGDDYGEENGSMETAGNGVSESEFEEQEQQYEDQEFV